jgi:2-iminobutanoate/2-iminopropanoate deaminase
MSLLVPRLVTECDVPGLAPPVGPYSHAVILGSQLYVSGLIPWDDDGKLVGEGDVVAQAEFIFATLGKILSSVGSAAGDVAKVTILLVNLADRTPLSRVRQGFFGAFRPASTLVQVAGLIGEGTLLEIEAIAGVRVK